MPGTPRLGVNCHKRKLEEKSTSHSVLGWLFGLQNFPSKKNTVRVNGIWRAENSPREKGDGFSALAPHNKKTLVVNLQGGVKSTKKSIEKCCQKHNGPKTLSLQTFFSSLSQLTSLRQTTTLLC